RFTVHGSRFTVHGSRFTVHGSRFTVHGSRLVSNHNSTTEYSMEKIQNNTVTLVLGGCRSGKSTYAQSLAEQHAGGHKVFVATSVPRDAEMQARVRRHQQDRGPSWQTVECPLNLADNIRRHRPKTDVLLIDCLTLWVANLLEEKAEEAFVFASAASLLETLKEAGCPIILVGNEVGAGIVPENPLARLFRDVNGFVNQRVAARANRVVWMVAGLPVPVKTEP
ncbi:MAG: bifunctional adenosylcobinamide kinase/adenosylcobinamide-phosphate guanylyltransferase, partial [Desulfohalobiaceae bacterium]|nr:bifunctional adenosylcobinamide kinase/adenosylcobinamide-phosphate guanylyltransferase [Desulfohalobiaceae bacterium]